MSMAYPPAAGGESHLGEPHLGQNPEPGAGPGPPTAQRIELQARRQDQRPEDQQPGDQRPEDQQPGDRQPEKQGPGQQVPEDQRRDWLGRQLQRIDRFQQPRKPLAIAVATWKKFSDDQAGNLAALVAYYAFVSLFPLLLVLVTLLDLLVRGNPTLRSQLLNSALSQYPVIGPQLNDHLHPLGSTGVALAVSIVLILYGARGVANAIQNAMNNVWDVPLYRRPGFPWSLLRSFGVIAVLGPGLIATVTLSGLAGGVGHVNGTLTRVAAIVVSLLLNVGLFWLGFRLATAKEVKTRDLRLAAILAAIAWQVLQWLGVYFVGHQLQRTHSAYGVFAVVLGLLAWLYLQAQITIYLVELTVVRVDELWPRSIAPPPLTDADVRAYERYAQVCQQRPDVNVEVSPPNAGRRTSRD
jgi:membrane protein